MNLNELFDELNEKDFISKDPIQIPYKYNKKEDIEISSFLVSILSFGRRNIIIKKSNLLMDMMENQPFNFIKENNDFSKFNSFVHRTINGTDIQYFLKSLKNIYEKYNGLESLFNNDIKKSLINFHDIFFELSHEKRTQKHIPNISKKSAAKRLNMFLRWMVRSNKVDFGLWHNINPKNLFIPLDIHVANSARKLNIIQRKSNDWKSVEEITNYLKNWNSEDPIKYDLVLFNLDI